MCPPSDSPYCKQVFSSLGGSDLAWGPDRMILFDLGQLQTAGPRWSHLPHTLMCDPREWETTGPFTAGRRGDFDSVLPIVAMWTFLYCQGYGIMNLVVILKIIEARLVFSVFKVNS